MASVMQFYGSDSILYAGNVSELVKNLRMSKKYYDSLPAVGECPRSSLGQNQSWLMSSLDQCSSSSSSVGKINANLTDLLNYLLTPACYADNLIGSDNDTSIPNNTADHVWGYGLLFVTLINLFSMLGIAFLPFMRLRVYKLVMNFMVSLAVGSLIASSLLVLLPKAIELGLIHEAVNAFDSSLIRDDKATWHGFISANPWYIWRSCSVVAGVYGFFLLERLLKELMNWKRDSKMRKLPPPCSLSIERQSNFATDIRYELPVTTAGTCAACAGPATENTNNNNNNNSNTNSEYNHNSYDKTNGNGPLLNGAGDLNKNEDTATALAIVEKQQQHDSSKEELQIKSGGCLNMSLSTVQPVAWMIIFGDAVHNFIDGLGIGAAFSSSTLSGISVSVAVMCEELPHELGDFAILLSAGMSMRVALIFNFLSACSCYAGFCLGVLIGEVQSGVVWVFGIASGMFLYISLVDMMPELNLAMEDEQVKYLGKWKVFLLQNLGLFVGFGVILLMALYGDKLSFGQ